MMTTPFFRSFQASALILFTAALLAAPATAQDRIAAESFTPAPAMRSSMLGVWGSQPLDRAELALSLNASHARRPLALFDARGDRLGNLLGAISTFELLGTIGVWERIDVSLAIPMHVVAAGTELAPGTPSAVRESVVSGDAVALGDVRLSPRVQLLGTRDRDANGPGLSLLAHVFLPSGRDAVYAGEGLRVEPRLIADHRIDRLRLAANVGYLVRGEERLLGARIDDMVTWGIGASFALERRLALLAEVAGRVNVLGENFGNGDLPTEGLLAVRYQDERLFAQIGGGAGLLGGVGEPNLRLFASLGIALSLRPTRIEPPPPAPVVTVVEEPTAPPAPAPEPPVEELAPAEEATEPAPIETSPEPPVETTTQEPPLPAALPEIRVPGRTSIPFTQESVELDDVVRSTLDAVAEAIAARPSTRRIAIEGYADASGPPRYNVFLSRQRAEAVMRYLVGKGVRRALFRIAAYGASRPTPDAPDQAARRVDVIVE